MRCSREQALATLERESERRYRSLADAVPQIVWTTDADGRRRTSTSAGTSTRAAPAASVAGAAEAIHPEDLARRARGLGGVEESGAVFETEYRMRRADGEWRWHLARARSGARCGGAITGWVGTATDIEDRRLAEERQRFLAEAGWVLGSSLDYERNLAEVARLAVRRIADVCIVDLLEDG